MSSRAGAAVRRYAASYRPYFVVKSVGERADPGYDLPRPQLARFLRLYCGNNKTAV